MQPLIWFDGLILPSNNKSSKSSRNCLLPNKKRGLSACSASPNELPNSRCLTDPDNHVAIGLHTIRRCAWVASICGSIKIWQRPLGVYDKGRAFGSSRETRSSERRRPEIYNDGGASWVLNCYCYIPNFSGGHYSGGDKWTFCSSAQGRPISTRKIDINHALV